MRGDGRKTIDVVPVAVVGAGPAGLAVSSRLASLGVRHVVLERDRIGWSWRTQRWESFRLNTPGWANLALGGCLSGAPAGFATARAVVAALERLAQGLPVVEGVEVLRARATGRSWRLETSDGLVAAGAVVVASGFQNVPRTPEYAAALPAEIDQIHVARYRRPADHDGPVLVVGGGQSGLQVAEDLLAAGHTVYLSTSRVGRLPRRYRGRDAFEWMRDAGQLELPAEQADPVAMAATPPQISGAAGGRTVSYQQLARSGATLLGHATGFDGRLVHLAPDLGANVRFADEASAAVRSRWDKRAAATSRAIEPAGELDPADEPAEDLYESTGPTSLDLVATDIRTVIWATGFTASTRWLPAGALAERGRPQLRGLHAIGAPWLTHRSSANLFGMAADAQRIATGFMGVGAAAA